MSENLDHTTGGTFAADDLIDEATANVKFPIIQAAEPSPTYDGQIWFDSDDNPLQMRVRDETNTQWLTRKAVYYESASSFTGPLGVAPLNGEITLFRDTANAKTQLVIACNNGWSLVLEES